MTASAAVRRAGSAVWYNERMRKIAALLTLIAMLALTGLTGVPSASGMSGPADASGSARALSATYASDTPVAPVTVGASDEVSAFEGLYSLADAGDYDLFINNVDGYALRVPKGLIVDMSYSSVRAVLEDNDTRIEIYKEDVSRVGKATYINYSNRFLSNKADHRLLYSLTQVIGGKKVTATAFTRDKLAKIENDKNHYLCLDIPIGKAVYTILIKTSQLIGELKDYAYLPRSLKLFTPTMPALDRRSKAFDIATRGWNDAAKAFYSAYFTPDAPLTWGIYEPSANWLDYKRVKKHEAEFGYVFPVQLQYTDFNLWYGEPDISARLRSARNQGKTVELTLQTNDAEDGGNMVYDILNGDHDAYLREYARMVADFGGPVLFRLGNEMNGEWCPYSAHHTARDTEIYKALYRYVYAIFEEAGADNVIWVWNPNGVSFPGFKWNHELMYYPGDEYVDIVGMTAYNTGTYYYASGERWIEFDTLYDGLYGSYLARYGQPLMITEFACSGMGGDKEAWVAGMFEHIRRYDRIKIAVWWDGKDLDKNGDVSRSYVIDDPPELTELFRRYLTELKRVKAAP